MKKLTLLTSIIFFVLINCLKSQEIQNQDSVFINFKNKATICFTTYDFKEIDKIEDINLVFNTFMDRLKNIENDIPESCKHATLLFHYSDDNRQTMKINENLNHSLTYHFNEDQYFNINKTSKYTIKLPLADQSQIVIKTDDLSNLNEISELDLKKLLNDTKREFGEVVQARINQNYYCYHNGNQLIEDSKNSISYHEPMDQIELTGGFGLASERNIWVPDLNTKLSFVFAKKGVLKNQYSISLQMKYVYNRYANGLIQSGFNPWLNIGYERNFSRHPSSSRWYGFQMGYLLNENGNFYGNNAFKVALSMRLSDHIKIYPEYYFGADPFPSVRIGFSF